MTFQFKNNPQAIEQFNAIVKHKSNLHHMIAGAFVGGGSMIGFLLESFMPGFVIGTIAAAWTYQYKHIGPKHYYSIEGTMDEEGHKCIFCGGRGIYRSTIYKTNIVVCKCSKCQTHLYNE